MGYNPNEPRNASGEWTDGGDAIKNAASDNVAEIKKRKKAKLKQHIALLNERLLEGGIGKKERRLIEARIESMSKEILSLMD